MAKVAVVKGRKPAGSGKIGGVDERTVNNLLQIFKSLSDKSRLRILLILAKDGEQHVSKICALLGQSQPAVSHHLTQLRNARLVAYRRDGKFNYYKIDSEAAKEILHKFYPTSKTAQQKLVFGEMELTFKSK